MRSHVQDFLGGLGLFEKGGKQGEMGGKGHTLSTCFYMDGEDDDGTTMGLDDCCSWSWMENDHGMKCCVDTEEQGDTRTGRKRVMRRLFEPEEEAAMTRKKAAATMEVPVKKSLFAKMLAMHKVPLGWKRDRKIRKVLAEMVASKDELLEVGGMPMQEENADNGNNSNKGKLVMVINRDNYTRCGGGGAVVFQCSECSYVGERYYHAGTDNFCLLFC